jgi:hypothetical protein
MQSLLALGCNGGRFSDYAANCLLHNYGCYSSVRYWILISCFNRGDKNTAQLHLEDWSGKTLKPVANISKFIPGTHYYTLNKKFNSFNAALEYIKLNNHQYGEFIEKYIKPI